MEKEEKRVVLKRGKIVVTRKGDFVIRLSKKITHWLKPFCRRIEVVGSIRRKSKKPVDIDIVLIPINKKKLEDFMMQKGKHLQGGEHESTWKVEGVKIELYYTVPEEWGAALLSYSSEFGAGIGLRVIARKQGFRLNNHGLFSRKTGKLTAGKTEREIYHVLGRPYKEPRER
jgi:DNA polymerase (family 10)